MIRRPPRRAAIRPDRIALIAATVSALAQLAPVLGRGYVLVRDMVFVPRPPLHDHLLGVDSLPRAVPSDLVVALLAHVLPADVVQDVLLLAVIILAGWGAARLLPEPSRTGAAAVAVLYTWNPYLTERLRQGQWAVLIGYAALPWAVGAALRFRTSTLRDGWRLVVPVGLAAIGGASAELLVALAVLPILLWPGGLHLVRRTAIGVGILVAFALPWLIPSLTGPSSYPADKVGVGLFAARADTPFGSVGSLLSLGGIWNSDVVPPGRRAVLVAVVALLMSVVSLVAFWTSRRRWPEPQALRGLVAAATLSFAVAAWGAVPGARVLLDHLVADVSAAGLLRDGQRWLAGFVLVVALGFGAAVEFAVGRLSVARVLVLAPVLVLPAAAWGSDGALTATSWPSDWTTVRTAASTLPSGPVLALPWSSVRLFTWNGGQPLTDPTALWLGRRTVGDDALDVGGVSTPIEDPASRHIAMAVTNDGTDLVAALRQQGYAGVLLDADQPGATADAMRLRSLPVIARTPTLVLYAVPGARSVPIAHAPVAPAVLADAVAAALLVAGFVAATSRVVGERRLNRQEDRV